MADLDPVSVGKRIRSLLKRADLSIENAAAHLGVHRNAVSNWINGYNMPQVGLIYDLIRLVPGVTLEWVYLGDDRMLPAPLARELGCGPPLSDKAARELAILIEAERQGLPVPQVPSLPAQSDRKDARRQTRKLANANG